jgi:rhodanese-related sulfurtransferase
MRVWLCVVVVLLGGCMTHPPMDAAQRPAVWAQPSAALSQAGLQNVYQIDDGLYRAEQPSDDVLAQLFAGTFTTPAGVRFKTVVNLRETPLDAPLALPDSQTQLVDLSLKTWDVEDQDILAFLRVATNPAQRPVIVHCRHGADRTGTMVAAYRMVVQGWSADAALAEMQQGGFGYHPIWVNLKRRIAQLPVVQMRERLGLPTQVVRQ